MGRRMPQRAVVVTTINPPNKALHALAEGCTRSGAAFLIAGDTKTPGDFALCGCEYLSVEEQSRRFPTICAVLPTKHYARKNVGYLAAMALGVDEIQETDDDNLPLDSFWEAAARPLPVDRVCTDQPWLNVYALFTDAPIWPRGFPLEYVQTPGYYTLSPNAKSKGLILQGLADGNPDVDAVYRLTRSLPLEFRHREPVMLDPGTWCPFNSQNTRFRAEAFPLMYLPSLCSFRMTDIWRSFVAQRCLWELGEGVVFHSSTVYQERNTHNLLKDFEDEVPGYLLNDRIRQVLDGCRLDAADMYGNMRRCYEALVAAGFVPEGELEILGAWCGEMENLGQ